MKILVINAGSSSLKYQLIDTDNEAVLAKGNCERIGQNGAFIGFKTPDGKKINRKTQMLNHTQAFEAVKNALIDPEYGAISDLSEVSAVGHRVVQGGAYFDKSVLVNNSVINKIRELAPLAPLHNPAHLQGIEACTRVFGPKVPQVAVFDTAFHQTMPEKAFMYAVPYKYYEKFGVRKYGFHGTSHRYVSEKMADLMGRKKEELKLITCHIGNGSSITAVKGGKVIDTTMGLTPLEGVVMGTRSGSIDPAIVEYIAKKENLDLAGVMNVLNKKSGLEGISGLSSDFRDLTAGAKEGNKRAIAAIEVFCYRVAKYVGSYVAAMNGVDAIAFTAGLGENDDITRKAICEYLGYLGTELDEVKNDVHGETAIISTDDSKVTLLCVPTNEELMIARDTVALVK